MKEDFYTVVPGDEKSSPWSVDCFVPEKISRKRAIFCITSKEWTPGEKNQLHPLCRAFRDHGFICGVASCQDPNAVTAFDQLSALRCAYERFVQEVVKAGAAPRIVVFGMTAGAHLASLLLCAKPGECGEKVQLAEPWIAPEAGMLESAPWQFNPWIEMFPHVWPKMQKAAGKPFAEDPELYERLSLRNYIRPGNPGIFFLEVQAGYIFPAPYKYALAEKQWSYKIDSWFKIYRHSTHDFIGNLTHYDEMVAVEDMCRFADR